jgi:hypothetical protein
MSSVALAQGGKSTPAVLTAVNIFFYRTYAKKSYSLDGIVRAYSYVAAGYTIGFANIKVRPYTLIHFA